MTSDEPSEDDPRRTRAVMAASDILREHGLEGLSTRLVAQHAGLQTPTLYRLFGDKQGLVDAVVHDWHHDHLLVQRSVPVGADGLGAVDALRAGWDAHVRFGLANPRLYALAQDDDGAPPPPAVEAVRLLRDRIRRLAEAGLLRVTQERAVQLVLAAGRGVTLALLAAPPDERDLGLSDLAREAVVAALVGRESAQDQDAGGEEAVTRAAVQLAALAPHSQALTPGEQTLLQEWLRRIADEGQGA